MAISTSGISVPQLGAGGGINSDIYGNTEAPKGMTLPELINMGRTNVALQREKALLEPEIERGKATAESAKTASEKAKLGLATDFADKMRQNQIALINDPLIVRAEQDPQFAATNKDKIAQLVERQAKAATEMGLDPTKAAELNAPYLEAVTQTNGQGLRQFLKTRMVAGLDQQAQAALQPGQYFQAAPTPVSETTGQPSGVTSQQMGQPAPSEISKPVPLLYPPIQAGQPRAQYPSEEEDRKVGSAVRSGLVARQSEIPTQKRNVDEVIKKAKELEKTEWSEGAGILGAAGRNLSTFLGTEQGVRYKELSKDLANAAISNIKATGGSLDTVAGQQLTRMANGDETYPPKVLIEIARRTQADMTALDSKAIAVQKFANKFGDNNIKAFEQMWSKNADPDIFQLKNIFESDMSNEEKAKARDKILGKDPAKAKLFNEKWNNIKKLEQTGTL
jgi:hypothetical protein